MKKGNPTMTLTKKQFDILDILIEEDGPITQRQLEEKTGYSLGSINKNMKEKKFIKNKVVYMNMSGVYDGNEGNRGQHVRPRLGRTQRRKHKSPSG